MMRFVEQFCWKDMTLFVFEGLHSGLVAHYPQVGGFRRPRASGFLNQDLVHGASHQSL